MAVAHVQDTPLVLINNAAGSITFPANTTVGNVVCLFVDTNIDITTTGRPVPTGGGVATWTLAALNTTGTVTSTCIYYGLVTSSGVKTINISDPSAAFWGAGASEFSGVSTTLVANVNYSTNGTPTAIVVGPLTPTAAGQLAFVGNGTTNSVNSSPYTAGAPWTQGTPLTLSGSVGDYGNTDWQVTTSTTALNANYTYTAGSTPQGASGIILAAAAATSSPAVVLRAPSFYVAAGPSFRPALFLPEPYAQAGVDTILTGVATGLALAAPPGVVAVTLPGATAGLTLAAPAGLASVTIPGTPAALSLAAPAGVVAVTLPGASAALTLAAPAGSASIGSNVNLTGVTAALTLAAPSGLVSAGLPGTTAALTLAAPAGTVSTGSNVNITGPTATISLAATAGTVAVTLPGTVAALAIAAPPGAVSVTIPGATAHLTLAATAGLVAVSLPGATAALVIAAPAGTVTIPGQVSIIGATVGLQLSAQAGLASVTLPGATARYVIAAPPGVASAGIGGPTARYVLATPAGSVTQGAPPPFTVGVLTGSEYAPTGAPRDTGSGDTAVSAPTATLAANDRKTGGPT